MDKRWLFVGVPVFVFVGSFIAVIVLLPFFLNADSFRPTVESQLSAALGREVTMGKLTLSLMKGSLVGQDLAIADDPVFSNVPFVQARSVAIGIEILPLLLHRRVHVTRLIVDTPSMQLIEHAAGKWNYSSLGRNPIATGSRPQSPLSDLQVDELRIVNGSALVSSVPTTAKPFEYTEVNLQIKELSLSTSFPFDLSAKLPGGGTVKLTGTAGPISQQDTSETPFQATLQVREFNPVSSGLIDRSKGILMNSDLDGEVKSDGTHLTSSGKIKASQLQLAAKGSPAQEPVDIDYAITKDSTTRAGSISDLAIHAGSAVIHVKGGFKFTPEATMLDMHLSAPALPIEQVERLLPVVGIRMPTGSSLQGGTLTASIAITGPVTSAIVTGPIEIDNTRLARFDLASSIDGLKGLASTAGGTDIRVLKTTLNSSAQGTRLADIYGDLPQVGTATGEGAVAPAGELDFRLNAKLYSSASATPARVDSSLRTNPKAAQGPTRSASITITGTATSPLISARVGASPR